MRSAVRWGFIVSLVLAALVGGCTGLGLKAGGAGQLGAVHVAFQLGTGATITAASYTVTAPGSFNRSGGIDVGSSATVSTAIDGLPAGGGYRIVVAASASDGTTGCGGSATFAVTAGATAAVTVHLTCHVAAPTGSLAVNGNINVCPNLESVGANPAEVVVGQGIALAVGADDPDRGPSPLAYHWTVGSGALDAAASPSPTFTCLRPGPVTITVAVSDGDPSPDCAVSGSVQINCGDPSAGRYAESVK